MRISRYLLIGMAFGAVAAPPDSGQDQAPQRAPKEEDHVAALEQKVPTPEGSLKIDEMENGCFSIELKPEKEGGAEIKPQVVCPPF